MRSDLSGSTCTPDGLVPQATELDSSRVWKVSHAEEFEIYCIGSLEFSRFTKVSVFRKY